MVALIIGVVIGVVTCFLLLAVYGWMLATKEPPDPEVMVQLHALRRRRELDEFKRGTTAAARRLRYELRQELRLLDDDPE